MDKTLARLGFLSTFATLLSKRGAIAQLVEQRTENPCVAGSIPAGTTTQRIPIIGVLFLFNRIIGELFSSQL